ncbi:hypothetical protein [Mycolicibacterium fortuitum]|uniref:hypothetical protein n=1 Tax=Mycolicibacterium fortuitum TaxID=1766 RepID=UPI003AAAE033
MTVPSDREVFLNEVREAIDAKVRELGLQFADMYGDVADATPLAEAAIDVMVRRMGPIF